MAKVNPILVDGKNEINGGKIYNAELNINSNRVSEVKISVVASSSDKYTFTSPSVASPKKITIGDLALNNMYNYKYSYKTSTNGSFLELYYKDWTWILDKYWVGLQGKHGWTKDYLIALKDQAYIDIDQATNLPKGYYERLDKRMKDIREGKPPTIPSKQPRSDIFEQQENLLIIGRLFHPCDKDKNNVIDPKEMGYDKCDPCPSCPDDKYDTKCFEYTETKIFETAYSFKDLIDFLPNVKFSNGVKDFTIKKPPGMPPLEYTGYFRDYHGPLREVLTSWANDFGCTLYADITKPNFEMSFLDTKDLAVKENALKKTYEGYIKDYSQNNKLISYEKEETIENTIKLGSITWYEREGERKSFDCTKSQAISLSPLFGVDLIGNRYRGIKSAGETKDVNADDDIASSVLGKYHPTFREAFWFRQVYGIKDQAAALSLMVDPDELSAALTPPEDLFGQQESDLAISDIGIRELGNLTIFSVVNTGIDVSKSTNKFHKLANANWSTLYNSLSERDQQEYSLNNGFFIIGYHDDDAFEKTLKVEDQLFDFIGRFFIREHMGRLCGITGTEEFVKQNTSINTPDGSAQIYTKSEGLQGSPLAKYKYYTSGYLGCVAPTKKTDVGNNNAWKYSPKLEEEKTWTYGKNMSTQNLQFGFYPMDGSITNSKGNPIIGYHNKSTSMPESYLAGDSSYGSEVKGNSIPSLFTQSTILLEREPKWYPSVEEYKQTYRSVMEKNTPLNLFQLKMLGLDGDPASSSWKNYPIYVASGVLGPNFEKIKVFLVYPGEFELECKPKDKGHPEEVSIWKKKRKQNIAPRPGGKFKSEYPLGLLGDRFHELMPKITTANGEDFEFPKIYTPPYTFWQKAPDFSKDFKREKELVKKMTNTTLCDSHLSKEIPREAGFRVSIEQKFNQTVIIPKIQTGLYGDITNEESTLKYDIKYNLIENEDFEAYSGYKGYGCVPNLNYLQNIHKEYTGLSVSITGASPAVRIDFKGLPQNLKSFFTDFGQSLTMNLSDNGVIGTIQYSTKNLKTLSEDLIKWKRRNNSI